MWQVNLVACSAAMVPDTRAPSEDMSMVAREAEGERGVPGEGNAGAKAGNEPRVKCGRGGGLYAFVEAVFARCLSV